MRNFRALTLIVPVLLLLGGCAGMPERLTEGALGLPTGILTQNIQNPVTREHLFRLENGLVVGVSALSTYKNYCNARPVGDRCDAVVQTMQAYVKRARPLLRQLRTFVRKNDQVNARVVFTTIQSLIAEFRGLAAAEGIALPV